MKLKYILIFAALLPAVESEAANAGDLSRYVYPENAISTPGMMTYLNDGKSYLQLADDGTRLVKYDIKTGDEIATVIDVASTRENKVKSIEGYILSPDESYIIIYQDKIPVYRRSFKAKYYVYEVRHNVLTPLSVEHPLQQSPLWSPDGRMISFMADNNIYIRKLDYNTEVAVTKDGEVNKIINGVPDWVYEEEFDTTCSMAWSPDNLTFCYLKYNETDVPLYSFPLYEGTCEPKPQYQLYPGSYSYKYPVAGERNSVVTLHSYDVDNRKTKDIPFNDSRIEYIPRIAYAGTSDRLVVTTLNRAQNRMEMYLVNPKSTVSKSLYVDENNSGWIDPVAWEGTRLYDDFFIVMSEKSGYNHLYQYSYSGAQMRQITSGDYDVTEYYGYEKATASHFYRRPCAVRLTAW